MLVEGPVSIIHLPVDCSELSCWSHRGRIVLTLDWFDERFMANGLGFRWRKNKCEWNYAIYTIVTQLLFNYNTLKWHVKTIHLSLRSALYIYNNTTRRPNTMDIIKIISNNPINIISHWKPRFNDHYHRLEVPAKHTIGIHFQPASEIVATHDPKPTERANSKKTEQNQTHYHVELQLPIPSWANTVRIFQ